MRTELLMGVSIERRPESLSILGKGESEIVITKDGSRYNLTKKESPKSWTYY